MLSSNAILSCYLCTHRIPALSVKPTEIFDRSKIWKKKSQKDQNAKPWEHDHEIFQRHQYSFMIAYVKPKLIPGLKYMMHAIVTIQSASEPRTSSGSGTLTSFFTLYLYFPLHYT